MKKLLLFILLIAGLASKAQTVRAIADSAYAHADYKTAYWKYYNMNWRQDAEVSRRLAFCTIKLGFDFGAPDDYCKNAIALEPDNSLSYYYLGLSYFNAAKEKKAIIEKPNDDLQLITWAKKNLPENKARAERYLKKAIELGNADAKLLYASLNGI